MSIFCLQNSLCFRFIYVLKEEEKLFLRLELKIKVRGVFFFLVFNVCYHFR